jgi:hypothetical protein
MDGKRFDTLTRRLATTRNRRSVLRGLVGGAVAISVAGGGATWAAPDPAKKVTICHDNNGAGDYVEITLSEQSARTHLFMHPDDHPGPCVCVAPREACTPGVNHCCGTNLCERRTGCLTVGRSGHCC